MYCSKQGSPELSKYFTSKGPCTAFCQDEEAKKEPPAGEDGGKCPFVLSGEERSSQLLTALTPPARPLRDNSIEKITSL